MTIISGTPGKVPMILGNPFMGSLATPLLGSLSIVQVITGGSLSIVRVITGRSIVVSPINCGCRIHGYTYANQKGPELWSVNWG